MRDGYTIAIENGADNYPEIEPLYRTHYAEMQTRLAREEIAIEDYAPRLDQYRASWRAGNLVNYILRKDGTAVGYANMYLTNDMHNGAPIAVEDTIYVLPAHRNGTGLALARFVLDDLRKRGVKRLFAQSVTDPRVARLWQRRLSFQPIGTAMMFVF
jgi:L-amino acid N-acyltransferase YncA